MTTLWDSFSFSPDQHAYARLGCSVAPAAVVRLRLMELGNAAEGLLAITVGTRSVRPATY